MLRSTYNQNKHIFFFPGRLNFNEHVNSNHIKKFLWLEKKMYKHQCPCKKKKKVKNSLAIIIMIEWKWRLETKCRLPTWCFWLINANPSILLVGHTRVIYSPCSVNSIYRTDDLKYSKVYLSLKTFKSFIEHSWFFTLLSLSVQQWPMILGTPISHP